MIRGQVFDFIHKIENLSFVTGRFVSLAAVDVECSQPVSHNLLLIIVDHKNLQPFIQISHRNRDWIAI